MDKLYIKTPLIKSHQFSEHLGIDVYLKLENLQPSGSFKNRGIGRLCDYYKSKGFKRLISSSGGNAGLAVAFSGKQLKVDVQVIVPKTTPELMIGKIKREGAEVIIYGDNWDEADKYAKTLLNDDLVAYIPPFDHPLIWDGHSTIIDEIIEEGVNPKAVLLAVGGGGLFCGVMEGLERNKLKNVTVIGAETQGCKAFHESLKQKRQVVLDKVETIATSIGAREVTKEAIKWFDKYNILSEVVTDLDALSALKLFLDDHRFMVDPACGAALSPAYLRRESLLKHSPLVIIVCGGCAVSIDLIAKWEKILNFNK